jgi:MSHA biogenesis protein MshN
MARAGTQPGGEVSGHPLSVINKMLQDLDRRQAISSGEQPSASQPVRAVERAHEREWFWRVVGALMLIATGWVGWVVYQLQPRTAVTELALKEAEQRSRGELQKAAQEPVLPAKPAPSPQPAPEAAPVAVTPTPSQAAAVSVPPSQEPARVDAPVVAALPQPAPASAPAAQPAPRSAPKVALAAAAKPKSVTKPPATSTKSAPADTLLALDFPPARILPHAPAKSLVERRDRANAPQDRAEREFRRAAELLKQGRQAEAEEGFAAALTYDASHRAARQALVALDLERGGLESARRRLQEGLAIDPAQPEFAYALARILVERNDYAGALDALQGALPVADNHPGFHALRGAILQRLARHGEAAAAFHTALQAQSSMPTAWVGLGISLEALERRPEAAEAFRRALASGPANDDLKGYAEQRIRALH